MTVLGLFPWQWPAVILLALCGLPALPGAWPFTVCNAVLWYAIAWLARRYGN